MLNRRRSLFVSRSKRERSRTGRAHQCLGSQSACRGLIQWGWGWSWVSARCRQCGRRRYGGGPAHCLACADGAEAVRHQVAVGGGERGTLALLLVPPRTGRGDAGAALRMRLLRAWPETPRVHAPENQMPVGPVELRSTDLVPFGELSEMRESWAVGARRRLTVAGGEKGLRWSVALSRPRPMRRQTRPGPQFHEHPGGALIYASDTRRGTETTR